MASPDFGPNCDVGSKSDPGPEYAGRSATGETLISDSPQNLVMARNLIAAQKLLILVLP